MIGAVVYVRVSDDRQTANLSLPTQLRACEEYCERQGFTVVQRFQEEGESAKTADRTELKKLLAYCRTNKGQVHFVVVYNLTRFAREKFDHFALRAQLKSLGVALRSVTEPIDDTSTGKLMEGVLAAFAQFDNDQRADRTRTGMRAALALGRWTFPAPLGYLNPPRAPKGSRSPTSLVLDPVRAPLIRRAFEEFATGRVAKHEVLALVNGLGLRTRSGLEVPSQRIGEILRNPVYIGRIELRQSGVSHQGDFPALVTEETFYRVQALLAGQTTIVAPRARSRADFPLRHFVRCGACQRPLTGSWSTGRARKRYPYYHCNQPACRAVNVRKVDLEDQFVELLRQLQPSPLLMRVIRFKVTDACRAANEDAKARVAEADRRVKLLEQRLDRLDEAFLFAGSIDKASYTRQRDKLREELTIARMVHHDDAIAGLDVEGILAFAERILPHAADMWVQSPLPQRQRLQQLFFPGGVAFDGAFNRTAVTATFYSWLRDSHDQENGLVDRPVLRWNPRPFLLQLDSLRRQAA